MTQILQTNDWIKRNGKPLSLYVLQDIKTLGDEEMRLFARYYSAHKYRNAGDLVEGKITHDAIANMIITRIKSGKYTNKIINIILNKDERVK